MEDLFKVVRLDSQGRLVSAILPDHLATVYRTADGDILSVPDSLAFDSRADAEHFFNPWNRSIGWLQLWSATAEVFDHAPAIIYSLRRILTCQPVHIYELTPEFLGDKQWQKLLDSLSRKQNKISTLRQGILVGESVLAPIGAVRCRDLQLGDRIK